MFLYMFSKIDKDVKISQEVLKLEKKNREEKTDTKK